MNLPNQAWVANCPTTITTNPNHPTGRGLEKERNREREEEGRQKAGREVCKGVAGKYLPDAELLRRGAATMAPYPRAAPDR